MTVKELITLLQDCDPDLQVEFPDTYWRSEGWGKDCASATCSIDSVNQRSDRVILEGD